MELNVNHCGTNYFLRFSLLVIERKMKKKYMILLSALSLASSTFAQTWIWYPGDYEIWLGNQMNNRRTERGAFFPPFWKTDSHYVVVEFSKQLNLSEPEEIFIAAEGTTSNWMESSSSVCRKPCCFRPENII